MRPERPVGGVQTPTFDAARRPVRGAARGRARLARRVDGPDRRPDQRRGRRGSRRSSRRVPPIVDGARAANPSLAIHAISSTFINEDINALISEGLDESLRLTIPLTFIILLFAFGAIVASVVPLVLAITSLVAAFGILGIYSQVVGPVSPNATQLIVLIGLAVAVDYSLFMITRFRVERRAGRDRAKAIEVSSSTAGRAVFFSGLAVMISLAGSDHARRLDLHVDGDRDDLGRLRLGHREPDVPAGDAGDPRRSGEPRTSGGLAAAARGGAPARPGPALGTVGDRLARPAGGAAGGQRLLGPAGDLGHGPAGADDDPVGRRSSSLLASPVLHLRTGITDITAFPDSIDGVAGIKLLNEKWPQGTDLQLAGRRHRGRPPRHAGRDRAAQDRGAQDRRAERAGGGHAVARRQGRAGLVHDGRQPERRGQPGDRPPGARASWRRRSSPALPDVRTYVTGDAAFSVDVTKVYSDGIPLIFAFVLGLSFLLMLVAFHSIVIPIKAILLNLLSTAAAYGVLVLVFQDGWFAGPLGITPSGVIESWVPLFIFTILFGLSMDYHLFILTRIKEARDRGLGIASGRRQGHLRDRRGDHQRGLDHGRRLRGLRRASSSCSSSSSGSAWPSRCSSMRP